MPRPRIHITLSDKVRARFLWVTIVMMVLVVGVAVFTIISSFRLPESPPIQTQVADLRVAPVEAELCPGEAQQFAATIADVQWSASGGTVSDRGLFVAGNVPGDYAVLALMPGSDHSAEAVVRILECAPTATPTASPTPEPTATPTLEPSPPPPEEAQGDVVTYDTGSSVESPGAGLDIRRASIQPDLSVNLGAAVGVPEELTGWAQDGEVLLWIELWDPIPDPPQAYTEWLAALDLDGDPETGRPTGSARINPDLGDEAALGVSYDPVSGDYVPYLLIWNPAIGDWAEGPDVVRYLISESRTVVGLVAPRDVLEAVVAEVGGASVDPDSARGRMAVLGYVGNQAVIDFYPDRPE